MTDTFNNFKKLDALIDEVRPYFLAQKERRRKKMQKIKAACAVFAFLALLSAPALNYGYNMIAYNSLSAQDLGFPTDEYGLIMVE